MFDYYDVIFYVKDEEIIKKVKDYILTYCNNVDIKEGFNDYVDMNYIRITGYMTYDQYNKIKDIVDSEEK